MLYNTPVRHSCAIPHICHAADIALCVGGYECVGMCVSGDYVNVSALAFPFVLGGEGISRLWCSLSGTINSTVKCQ